MALQIFGGKSAGGSSAPAANLTDTGYDVFILAGQSNMQGDSAGAVSSSVDITDPRVWSWGATGANAGTLAQASDPLAHRGSGVGTTIVGPGMAFARWLVGTLPGNRRILLVPAAYNGTAILSGSPKWDPTAPEGASNLYSLAIAQTAAAIAGTPNARLAGILWVQGESDALNNTTATAYRTALEQIIDGFRARLSAPTLPFIIGSMLPEFVAAGSDTRAAIHAVHQDVPNRKAYTAFVQGPSGLSRGDNLHYSPAGQREQGRRMVAGLAAARLNTTPSNLQAVNPPVAATTTTVTDDFNRADSTSVVGTMSGGPLTWTAINSTWGISTNRAYPSAITGGSNGLLVVDSGATTGVMQVTHSVQDSGTALAWRVVDKDNWYAILLSNFTVYKRVAGTVTSIGGGFSAGANGDVCRVEVAGNTFTFFKNGAQVGTVTDSSLTTGTKWGIRADTVSARFDDFSLTYP